MREILFRGKPKNGEWLYGQFVTIRGKSYIHKELIYREVIPETVGQYTGITRNGKRVFEGDICQKINNHGADEICVVKWINECARFALGDNDECLCNAYFEVIGNIHDNPELLEVQNET